MSTRRSPAAIGALGILLILLVTSSAFFLDDLPIIGAGSNYQAEFSESAGLKKSDEVRIAGVKVGQVSSVELDGDKVIVSFKAKDVFIGEESTASIQIKTLLGQKYMSIEPRGSEQLEPGSRIPLERTRSPYDVIEAFSATARTLNDIEQPQLAESMRVLSDAFAQTPPDIRASLDGISRLSETIDSRHEQLNKLFEATAKTTTILADRNEQFTQLLASGGELLEELNFRQQAISTLLTGTTRLSEQLTALIQENEATIGPALEQLRGVVQILQNNNDNLARGLVLYEPFVRVFTNVLGNGRWFDQVVVNLIPPGLPLIPGYRDPVRDLNVGPTGGNN